MYRIVLCLRYLMSRFLTLVATGAVLLGVGTLIVVMAVMGGFVRQVRQAVRGALSDVIIEHDVTGFPYYDDFIREIKEHPNVEEATPVAHLFGLVQITVSRGGQKLNRPCMIFGVRPEEISRVSRFHGFLERQADSDRPTFDIPDEVADRLRRADARAYTGCIPGRELVNYRIPKQERSETSKDVTELLLARRGDKLVLTTLPVSRSGALGSGFGRAVTPRMMGFTVVDHFKSRLYQFDKEYIFIPFASAQALGELGDLTGEDPSDPPRAHQIRVSLKEPAKARETIADLERMWAAFRQHPDRAMNLLGVQPSMLTWEERQATILQVVNTERTLMIILLGLVIVIAGFLIGAILTMIVKEKTRDIGILKSLGASNVGAAQIFLFYAALVSTVGALLGLLAALVFIDHIDGIRELVSRTLGFEVFSPEAYYFDKIPRYVDPYFTAAAVAGAVAWAVLCSAIAAYRAARLQPVEALRHE